MEKDLFLKEIERNPFSYFHARGNPKSQNSKDRNSPDESEAFFLPYFFVELIQRIKSVVGSARTLAHISRDKPDNPEFREYLFKIINEDIDEVDTVLNSLINYIKINTPIVKSNTVHTVLDELLKKYGNQIEAKKIRIVKKFEKHLPETIVHEEQLRYILNSIFEYAISLTFPNGSIGLLTKSLESPKEGEEGKSSESRLVEVIIMFSGCRRPPEQTETALKTSGIQKEESVDLTLLLSREIIRKNKGEMRLEVDEKKPKTTLSIAFPVERRKVVFYPTM
jgi:nitrogen-specific signal transduction histidine kinase